MGRGGKGQRRRRGEEGEMDEDKLERGKGQRKEEKAQVVNMGSSFIYLSIR